MPAGTTIAASDFEDANGLLTTTDYIPSDTATALSGFTVQTGTVARTMLGGHLIMVELFVTTTSAITATSGNITDTDIATLKPLFWPTETINAIFGNGSMDGECTINTAGTVTLRSASATIAAASNLRITATYIQA